jgi:hypothetical protein
MARRWTIIVRRRGHFGWHNSRVRIYSAALWRQEARLAETDGFAFLEPDEIKNMDRQDAIELDGLMRFADRMFCRRAKGENRTRARSRRPRLRSL